MRTYFIFSQEYRFQIVVALTTAILPTSIIHAADETKNNIVSVTARYWQETVADVPASVKVIEVKDISGELENVTNLVSNVRIEKSSVQTRTVIRGNSSYDTGLQDPVAYYIDGVALPLGGNQLPISLDFAQQLEIIKGPQGALYGRNSESGVIKLTTYQPNPEPSTFAKFETGAIGGANDDKNSSLISLGSTGSLIDDKLFGSLALNYKDSEGPFLNRSNGNTDGGAFENWSISAGLDFNVHPTTSIRLRSFFNEDNVGKSQLRYVDGINATERFVTDENSNTFDDKRSSINSITLDHQIDNINLISITGYTKYDRKFQADLDLTQAPIPETLYNLTDDTFSQEFRLQSDWNNNIRWLTGLYFYRQNTDVDFTIGGSQFLPRSTRETEIKEHGVAVFGQVEFGLGSKWDVELATRLERVAKKGEQNYSTNMAIRSYGSDENKTVLLPKASLIYQFSDDAIMYLSAASGYLPGGFNYGSAQSLESFTYDAETSRNYELGYKTVLYDDKLKVNAALFHTETKDKQVVDLLPGFVQNIDNLAKSNSYGLELDVDYKLTNNLSFYGHLGWMKAKADTYNTVADFSGNDLPMAPNFTYGLGVTYDRGKGVFGSLNLSGSGDYYFDIANGIKQSGYEKIDGQIGYHFDGGSLSLVAKNIFDAEIVSRAVNTAVGTVVEDTAARYVGLKLETKW